MRRAPLLLALLLAACSSGTATVGSPSPLAPTTLAPTSASPAPAAVLTSSKLPTATKTAQPTRTPASRRTASATAAPRLTATRSPSPKPSPTRIAETYIINEQAPDRFSPTKLTLRVGDTVLVQNQDAADHNFTISALHKDSGNMGPGDTYELRFSTTGTFQFVCTYHETLGMKGTVTVKA